MVQIGGNNSNYSNNKNCSKNMSIYRKLNEIQSKLEAPKNQTNAFGKYKYRSAEDILAALKPHLELHGLVLVITDEILLIGTRYYVKATVRLSDGTESIETTALAREPEAKKGADDSQVTGATSSYARKYALNGMFAIDDTKDADATNTHGKQASNDYDADGYPANAQVLIDVMKGSGDIESLQNWFKWGAQKFKADISAITAVKDEMKIKLTQAA